MSNELTKRDESFVAVIKDHEIGNLIKPLIRDIHLFDTYIAGITHLPDQAILDKLKHGDILSLQRAADKFDRNAVMVLSSDKMKLGYLPEKDNIIFARLMDAGKILRAKIINIDSKGGVKLIRIGIFLEYVKVFL